tara:strand:- start:8231 stop:11248 length:3018 start_codon:yes stop_codon:yes gene_type:complete
MFLSFFNRNHLIFYFFLLISFSKSISQIDPAQILEERFLGIYYQGLYPNVSQSLATIDNTKMNSNQIERINFYKISSSLRLNEISAEKMIENFQHLYPESRFYKTIYFDVANYYFENEKYSYAYKWFLKADRSKISLQSLPKYYFNKGYTFFLKKKYSEAKELFENVKNDPKYESDAHYYLGHISYQLEDYESASDSFTRVTKRNQQEDLSYFQVEMNFKLGRFQKAVELGLEELKKTDRNLFSQISKIVGESYFNLGKYQESIKYLQNYNGESDNWTNMDYYQLGYAYYSSQDYSNAIENFNKIIGDKDELSQNAYFYLAECYLKNSQKLASLNAYKSAFEIDYDPQISKNSLLNYARLSYEIGNPYEKVPDVLKYYLSKYPQSTEEEEITKLLIDSYTKSGNYDSALDILNSGSFRDEGLLQKVTFLNGIKFFNSGSYEKAYKFFSKSINYPNDNRIFVQSHFWKGQSAYELNEFSSAIESFLKFKKFNIGAFFEESLLLNYHLAYSLFKLERYEEAILNFQKILNKKQLIPKKVINDTYLRIGDAYFLLSDYLPAINYYDKSISVSPDNSEYALFQKAMSYGYLDRDKEKNETLINLISIKSSSYLVDDSLYELGNYFSSIGSYDPAIKYYDELINNHKNSKFFARTKLNKGLALYNMGKIEASDSLLRNLAIDLKDNPITLQALKTLKEIAVDLDNISEFTTWVRTFNFKTFSDNELERTAFEVVENYFLQGERKRAEKAINIYLQSYPNGRYSVVSIFYLAEIYFFQEKWDLALKSYLKIIDFSINDYTERAIVRSTQILFNENKFKKAVPLWEKLEKIASFPENKRYAQFNLMRTYFNLSEFDKAIAKADIVLSYDNLEPKVMWDAKYFLAKSYLGKKDTLSAKNIFLKIEKSPIDSLAVEAHYLKAQWKHKDKAYKESNEIISIISEKYNDQPFWAAKSLFLMAKNFYMQNDIFQATYILKSLLDNFVQFPKINSEAKKYLLMIEKNQNKKNDVDEKN